MDIPLVFIEESSLVKTTTHIKIGEVYYQRKEFFYYLNKLHLSGENIKPLADRFNIKSSAIYRAFKRYNLPRLSKESSISITKSRREKTLSERYGFTNPFKSNSVQKSIKESNKKKYGHHSPLKSESVKAKIRSVNLQRYGYENPLNNPDVRNRAVNSIRDKYSSDIHDVNTTKMMSRLESWGYTLLEDYKGIYEFTDTRRVSEYRLKCKSCGFEFEDGLESSPFCPNCSISDSRWKSNTEVCLHSFISGNLGIPASSGYRGFRSSGINELDIYIPSHNLAIEYNGFAYHHSSLIDLSKNEQFYSKPKSSTHHQKLTNKCLSLGISLLHIWQDSDLGKVKDFMKYKFHHSSILTIHTRKLKIVKLTNKQSDQFFKENHLHNSAPSTIYYGLQDPDSEDLLSVVSFKQLSKSHFELVRFAVKRLYSIPGAFSKLLKHFIKEHSPTSILSYAYCDLSPDPTQTVYARSGFKYIGQTAPMLYYCNKSFTKRESRQKYQKHKLKSLFPESYDPSLTAKQILARQGLHPIYNSGNHKFMLTI